MCHKSIHFHNINIEYIEIFFVFSGLQRLAGKWISFVHNFCLPNGSYNSRSGEEKKLSLSHTVFVSHTYRELILLSRQRNDRKIFT